MRTQRNIHFRMLQQAIVPIVLAAVLATIIPTGSAGAAPEPLPPLPPALSSEVLILASTVLGGLDSIEARQVAAKGLIPIVVDDATWSRKSTIEFASYRALVIGDPSCSPSAPAAAIANAATWGPAVTGNVLINGTDPVFHAWQGGRQATERFVDFSVSNPEKTGAYISLSCNFHGAAPHTPVPLLDAIRPGGFSVTGVGCYDDAHIVATHPALTGLSDSTLSNWGCSVHEAFDMYPPDFQVLAMARNIGSTYTASDGTVGTPYILASGSGLRSFPLSLSPSGGTAPVGRSHTVTAQLLDAADSTPVAGASISFAVIDGPDVGAIGRCSNERLCSTDVAGQVSWTWTNSGRAGVDTVQAFLDNNGNGRADVGEPQATAGMTWTIPPPPQVPPEDDDGYTWADCLYSKPPLDDSVIVAVFGNSIDDQTHDLICNKVRHIRNSHGFDEDTPDCIAKVLSSPDVERRLSPKDPTSYIWTLKTVYRVGQARRIFIAAVRTERASGKILSAHTNDAPLNLNPYFDGLYDEDRPDGDWAGCLEGRRSLPLPWDVPA